MLSVYYSAFEWTQYSKPSIEFALEQGNYI